MFEKLVLKLTLRILNKTGGMVKVNNIYVARMSTEFCGWVYSDGYKIFKEKQSRIKSFEKSIREMNYKHNFLEH